MYYIVLYNNNVIVYSADPACERFSGFSEITVESLRFSEESETLSLRLWRVTPRSLCRKGGKGRETFPC